jgi:predicted ferric reductase
MPTRHVNTTLAATGSPPRRWIPDLLSLGAGIGLGVSVTLALSVETHGLLSAPGGYYDAVARVCAMAGTYLLIVMVLLMARIPGLERAVGQDRLVAWHRRIGGWPVLLITMHVLFVTLGYAAAAHTGVFSQFRVFLTSYNGMLTATAAVLTILVASGISIKAVRSTMKYEYWWLVHLTLYIAMALAYQHQISTGIMFIGHPLAAAYWRALWACSALVLVYSRIAVPIWRNLRHQLIVASVDTVSPGVTSVVISGRSLDKLNASGGQFFQWRFLTPKLWWHAHPYSMSALPRPPYMRLTVKDLGDHSRSLSTLVPGTRVVVEGPYGAMTHHHRATNAVTMIGAGVGITPLRAMLDDIPNNVKVAMVIRASSPEDIIHKDEIEAYLKQRNGLYYPVIGPRESVRFDADSLRRAIPHIAKSDVYVCGPQSFSDMVIDALRDLRIPESQIHNEAFSF